MQHGMAEIEAAGLLPRILGKLSDVYDFLTCAAVSRSWQTATSNVQFRSLCLIMGPSDGFAHNICAGMRQWIMRRLQDGKLTCLTEFQLLARQTRFDREPAKAVVKLALSNLYCTAATVLGVGSQLQICHLSDGITIADAAQFLPTSLQELHLTYRTFDDCVCDSIYSGVVTGESDDSDTSDDSDHGSILAGCERLCNLRKLCIEFEEPSCSPLSCRLTHVMPKLQHLEVYGAKLVVEKERSIAELLPNVEFL